MFFGAGRIENGGGCYISLLFLTNCDVFKQLNSKQAAGIGT